MKRLSSIIMCAALTAFIAAGCGKAPYESPSGTESKESEVSEASEVSQASEETISEAPSETAGIKEGNNLFYITLPEEAAGLYYTESYNNGISVFDKEAAKDGYGGFAFNVIAYREPSEYAGGMDFKVGEFIDSDGNLYDIVMQYPSDVQYNYQKYSDGMPESYKMLYDGSEDIVKTLTAVDGKGKFIYGGGTKGEDLYGSVINKYKVAIKEGWDGERLSNEDMSYMYSLIGDKAGYKYLDVNNDGVDELLIGENAEGDMKGSIYDVYTMVDRKPAHVVSGWDRSRFYALEYGMLVSVYSSSAMESTWKTFDIEPNTTRLLPQILLKYDENTDANNPWFISYDEGDSWESLTEEEFEQRRNESSYLRLVFTPFLN